MADKRISELPNLSAIEDSALLVVEFNGVAYHLTGKQFKDFAESVAGSGGGSSGGSGGGDMATATYDPDGAVALAGGIKAYVSDIVDDLDVPAVTTDDNGKFLRVVNGAWAAEALPSAEGGSF